MQYKSFIKKSIRGKNVKKCKKKIINWNYLNIISLWDCFRILQCYSEITF